MASQISSISVDIQKGITTESSSVGRTSNPRPKETFSNFGDGSCGEPLFAQHLLIDFTPDEVIDNDFSQRKICAFWEFINNTPEIKNLMAKPERNAFTTVASETSESEKDEPISMDGAISILDFVKEKGLIDRTFEAKLPQSMCTLGSREYKDEEAITLEQEIKKLADCKCAKPSQPCPVPNENTKAKKLCKKLEDWDTQHPKSMKPPGHAPALQHCILQRQVY